MAKKEENVFDLKTALCEIEDAEFKVKAFYNYVTKLDIKIKDKKELDKKYNEFYGGK